MAQRLDELNSERREIENRVRDAALEQAEARGLDGPLVWAAGQGWHPGVVGIVASRLKEATNRPAVVIGFEDGIGKGSARSVSGVDLGAAVQRVAAEGLLVTGLSPLERDLLDAAKQKPKQILQGGGSYGSSASMSARAA